MKISQLAILLFTALLASSCCCNDPDQSSYFPAEELKMAREARERGELDDNDFDFARRVILNNYAERMRLLRAQEAGVPYKE